jgi:hypothetical protein
VASTLGVVEMVAILTPDYKGEGDWFKIIHVKVMEKVKSVLRLGMKNSFLGLKNLEAKEIMQIAQVCHFKFLFKSGFHMG